MSFIRLPEVEIPLPSVVVYLLETTHESLSVTYSWLLKACDWFKISPELYDHLKANALLLVCVSLIFWPLLLSLITAVTTMGAWSFWLLTTAIFGVLQLFYVVYQFVMIAVDILGLSILKTYTMLRNRAMNYLGRAGTWDQARNRRLVWKDRLEAAGSYENFLKIQIEAHTPAPKKLERRRSDPAIMRSSSFGKMEGLDSPKRMSRNRSYSSLMTAGSEDTEHVQPVDEEVVEELGEMAAVMLTTTKQRLKEARQTAMKHEEDAEAMSTLKQLLQGVVKRNHLNVDNFLIQNARAVASSGQYGLSSRSRKVIHSYFEEVEKGLDWIADAPLPEESTSPKNESILEGDESDEAGHELPFSHIRNRTAEINDRITLIRKIRANVGRTSLMLSGGGAQVRFWSTSALQNIAKFSVHWTCLFHKAMYHLGVVRALIEANVYQDIKVISGMSANAMQDCEFKLFVSNRTMQEHPAVPLRPPCALSRHRRSCTRMCASPL